MPYPYRNIREWLKDEEEAGNIFRTNEPIYCGDYDNLVDIGFEKYNPIDDPKGLMNGKIPKTDVRAFARYLHSLPNDPTGIIEKPICNRPDISVVISPWSTDQKVLRGMGLDHPLQIREKLAVMLETKIKSEVIPKNQAACKQNIITEDKIDLTKNIPRIWVEFNKLCFTGCNGTIISYDPERDTHGLTKTRLGVFDWDNGDPNQPFTEDKIKRYGFATMARPGRPGQGNTGRFYFENYRNKGKNWPTAFVYGIPADMHQVAALKSLKWPEMGDEYEIVGGIRGEPIELVECETIPGMMVPAHAEWVIEGEFVSEDYLTPVNSEDLAYGFIWGEALWPVFKVNCITHRNNPLWTATTFSSWGHKEHNGMHGGIFVGVLQDTVNSLRKMGYLIKDVAAHSAGWVFVIQLEVDGKDKPHPGYGEEVGRAAGGMYTIVVGPDINIHDLEEVMWAVGMRAGRSEWRDLPAPKYGPPMPRYGIFNELTTDRGSLVIDATIPVPERFDTFPPRTEPPVWEDEAIEFMKKKLGKG